MQYRMYLAIAITVGSGTSIAAEPTDLRLDEIVVTATKTKKETADAPATVSVISADEIDAANVQSADEALTAVPGVYTSRPGGHQPSVMGTNALLRGLPDYSRTLVLVDGQALNDPYIGAVTWESVPPETIDRIEVVPGPFSSLYGGSAMGGVINIISKKPEKRDVAAKAGYGTDRFRSGTLVYQDRNDAGIGLVLDIGYKASDGYVKDEVVRAAADGATGTPVSGATATTDPYGNERYLVGDKGRNPWEALNAGAKVYIDVSDSKQLSFSASHFEYEKQRAQFNTYLRDASGNPVSSGTVTFDDAGAGKTMTLSEASFLSGPNPKEQNRFAVTYDQQQGGGAEFKILLGYLDTPVYDYTIPKSGATYDGGPGSRLHRPNREASSTFQFSFPFGERQFLVTGISAGRREIDTYQYAIDDWRDAGATGTTENQTAGKDSSYAVFVQDEISLGRRVTAYLGGRYDWWSTEGYIEQVKAPAYRTEYAERSQSYFSPKASLVFRPRQATTLRASAGQAFHPPMLRDTFGWWTPTNTALTYQPNPDLKPETVTSWEIGLEQRYGVGWIFRATYYESYLHDLIYRTQTATTETITNAAKAEIKGVEVELRKQLNRQMEVFSNATYNNARITENSAKPETEGKRMTRTPAKLANAGVRGKHRRLSLSLYAHYVGKVYANDENLDVVNNVYGSYDPYVIANTKVEYQLTDRGSLSLAIDNLLDRDYYESTRAQGRAFFGELSWRF